MTEEIHETEATTACPNCGKEILATAKKCKHCGEWLEKKCPHCGEWIKADAMKCRYCGSWLNKFAKERYERENNIAQPVDPALEERRRKKEKAAVNASAAGCLMLGEFAVALTLIAFASGWSWWQVVLAGIGGLLLMSFHTVRFLYCIAISFLWACWGAVVGGGSLWIGAVSFVFSLVIHWPIMKLP